MATRPAAREAVKPLLGRKGRVLLAEDNITNQQVALGMLKRLGLAADAVANGAEALHALKTLPYDLVLMDVQMPEMDGFEATQRIRDPSSGLPNPGIPIIAMTAHAMQGDREKCLEAGMDDYIPKPVEPATLAEVLEKWLPAEAAPTKLPPAPAAAGKSPVTDTTEKPVFNRAALMNRLMDEDLMKMVLTDFLGDLPGRLKALKTSLETGDLATVARQAHTIKGSASTAGGEALSALAREMEFASKAGDQAAAAACLANLEEGFQRLKEAIALDS